MRKHAIRSKIKEIIHINEEARDKQKIKEIINIDVEARDKIDIDLNQYMPKLILCLTNLLQKGNNHVLVQIR